MINMRSIRYIPESTNFSAITENVPEENNDELLGYEASDGGRQVEQTLSNVQGDQLLISLLLSLDNRDKIVLLYQVLREAGYNLQQEECAKTLSISRSGYVVLVKSVKRKCLKILRDQKIV